MDRLKVNDGQDLWKESYEFIFEGIIKEFRETLLSVLEPSLQNNYGGILYGFDLQLDGSDPTKLEIVHTSTGTGALVTKAGQLIFSSTGLAGIELTDYSNGVINLVLAKHNEVEGYQQYNQVYNVWQNTRIYDSYKIDVLTESQYNVLSESQKAEYVELGRAVGQGAGNSPILNLSTRNYVGPVLQKFKITEEMLHPTFKIFQTVVRASQVYNDNFSGTPQNLEDDLNEIRTILKEIKGTVSYKSTAPGTLYDFDRDVTGLHGEGVFRNVDQEFQLVLTGGLNLSISPGKALVAKKVSRVTTSTGLSVDPPSEIEVGDWESKTGFEELTFGSQPDTQNLAHDDIVPGSVHITDGSNEKYTEGEDYTVDYETGAITSVVGGNIVNETVRCYYKYYLPRIDIVQLDDNHTLSIKKGTPQDNPEEPDPDTNNIKLWAILVSEGVSALDPSDVTDRRTYLDIIPRMKKVLENDIYAVRTSYGNRLNQLERFMTEEFIDKDYKNVNMTYDNLFTETFLTDENQDKVIENSVNELAEVRKAAVEQFDPKTYRYRDWQNKKELKEGVLFNQRKYYWGQYTGESWRYGGRMEVGDLEYDEWRDCFWTASFLMNDPSSGIVYKFTTDSDGNINVLGWWKLSGVNSTSNSYISGICVDDSNIYFLVIDNSSGSTDLHKKSISGLPESGNVITPDSSSSLLGNRLGYGLTFDGTNLRFNYKVDSINYVGVADRNTLKFISAQCKEKYFIGNTVRGIAFDRNNNLLYLVDTATPNNVYIFDSSLNCIGLLEMRTSDSYFLCLKDSDLFVRERTNLMIDKYKIKNTVKLLGQIREWKYISEPNNLYGLAWDSYENCWWATEYGTNIYKYDENWNLLATYPINGTGIDSNSVFIGIDIDDTYLYIGHYNNVISSSIPAVIRIDKSTLNTSGTTYTSAVVITDKTSGSKGCIGVALGEGNDLYANIVDTVSGICKFDKTQNNQMASSVYVANENGIYEYVNIAYKDNKLFLVERYTSNWEDSNRIISVDLTKDNTSKPQIINKFNFIKLSPGTGWMGGLTFKNNELYIGTNHGSLTNKIAKLSLNTQPDEDNWIYFFNSNTSPVKLLSDNVYCIAYGERYYSPDEYVNKTYVLPEKFLVVGTDKGIDIIDITNPKSPVKFISFEIGTSNVLLAPINPTTFYRASIKTYKDVIYWGCATNVEDPGLVIIDFKNDQVFVIRSGGFYKYNGDIRTRNDGLGYTMIDSNFCATNAIDTIDVKEINRSLYIAIGGGGYLLFLINFTSRAFYRWKMDTSAVSGVFGSVLISDDNKLYIAFYNSPGNRAGLHVIGDITKIYRNNNDNTTADNCYWKDDTGYGKRYSSTTSPAIKNSVVNDIKVISEYDIYGNWKTNKIYLAEGAIESSDYLCAEVIDESNGEIATFYNYGSSPSGTKSLFVFDDLVGIIYGSSQNAVTHTDLWKRIEDNPYTGVATYKKRYLEIHQTTYPLMFGAGSYDGTGKFKVRDVLTIRNQILVHCSNFGLSYVIFDPFVEDSIYQSSVFQIDQDIKQCSFIMSEKKSKGYRVTFIDDTDPDIVYSTNWTGSNSSEDYNKTSHTTSSVGETATYVTSTGIKKVGLITRFGSGFGQIKVTITDSLGDKVVTVDTNESMTDYRRLIWLADDLTIGETHTITIENIDGNTIYFDALVLVEELDNDNVIEAQVSPNNGSDWYTLSETVPTEFIKEEYFSGDGTTTDFQMTNESSDIKEVWVDEGSGFEEKIYGIDWTHEDTDGDNKRLIKFINGYVPSSGTDNIKVIYYPLCSNAILKVTMKQPSDESGFYDEFVESYITDLGVYFGK